MSKALRGYKLPWTLWKRTGAYRCISFSQGMSMFSGEITKQSTSIDDSLTSDLTAATTSTDILKIVDKNYKNMNSEHVMYALKSIFTLQKNNHGTVPMTSILKHPGFLKLSQRLKAHSGVLDLHDIIQALKTISYIRVASNSTITQVLLQLIRQNINSLSIQQITFLDFLITDFERTPLVEALSIALPVVFEIHVAKKMDRRNGSHMAECLSYAVRHRLTNDTIDTIIYALKQHTDEFDGQTAKKIIISLCNLQKSLEVESLYKKCVTDIIVNIDQLNFNDISFTVYKMAHQYKKSHPFYYEEVFFDTVANQCIDLKTDLTNSTYLLRQLARVRHFHKNLLDYVSTLLHENPDEPCDPITCFGMVSAVVLADYKPIHWKAVEDWIKNARDLALVNKREILWIRFAASLCLLGIYKADVLSRALNRAYLEHLFAKGFMSDFENYFTIWKMIHVYNPNLTDLLPSNFEPKKLIDHVHVSKEYPLEAPLERCLGGPQFLLTKLYSKMGDIIGENACVPSYFERVKFWKRLLGYEKRSNMVERGAKISRRAVSHC